MSGGNGFYTAMKQTCDAQSITEQKTTLSLPVDSFFESLDSFFREFRRNLVEFHTVSEGNEFYTVKEATVTV